MNMKTYVLAHYYIADIGLIIGKIRAKAEETVNDVIKKSEIMNCK
jgi:hypothetical protein